MAETVPNRFNLVDEKWIPIANEGLASLKDIFSNAHYTALGGNPIQKIALTKLLLAIAQAACTPMDDDEWKRIGAKGIAEKALGYLTDKKECFWLYGERPFLQMPEIAKAAKQSFGAISAGIATGNTTVLLQSQSEQNLTDAEKALLIVELGNFALGGKKTDNTIVLSPGYAGKTNDKGKPGTGKPGPAEGFLGFLHTFLVGSTIKESLWLNTFTKEQINAFANYAHGIGTAPWERMPKGENCERAEELKTTYMGRLVPVSRFTLLMDDGLHYSEGISYPGYAQGGFDASIGVDFSAIKPRALWVNPERRPWRQLTSLLAFFSIDRRNTYDCLQLRIGLPRARQVLPSIGIWSGGLKVSNNAGEQFASGTDDFVESEFSFKSAWLGKDWFLRLKTEMAVIEDLSKTVYGCTRGYFKQQKAEGNDQAAQAGSLFWQLAEHHFQDLINACGIDEGMAMRPLFTHAANKAYNTYCPRDTARQLDAWAACRSQLGKYIHPKSNDSSSTNSQEKGE